MAGGGGKQTNALHGKKKKGWNKSKPKEPYEHIASSFLPSAAVAAAVPQSPKHILRSRSPSPIARAIAHASKIAHSIIGPLPAANYNERYVGAIDDEEEDPAYATVGTLTNKPSTSREHSNMPDSIKHRPPMPLPPEAIEAEKKRPLPAAEAASLYAKVDKTRRPSEEEAYSAETISDDEITDVSNTFNREELEASLGRFQPSENINGNLAAIGSRGVEVHDKQRYPNFDEPNPHKTWMSPSDFYQPDDFNKSESATPTDDSYKEPTSIKSLDNNANKTPSKKKKLACSVSQSVPCLMSETPDDKDGVNGRKPPPHPEQKLVVAKDLNANEIPFTTTGNVDIVIQKNEEIYQRFDSELRRFNSLINSMHSQQQANNTSASAAKPVVDHSQTQNLVKLATNLETMQSQFEEQQKNLIEAFKRLEREVSNSYAKEKSFVDASNDLPKPKLLEHPLEPSIPLPTPKFDSPRHNRLQSMNLMSAASTQQFDEERSDLLRTINHRDDMLSQLRSSKRYQAENLLKQVTQMEREKEELELRCYQKEVENANLQRLVSTLKGNCINQMSIEDHRLEMQQQRDEFQMSLNDLQRRNDDMSETVLANKRETKRLALLLADNKATLMKEKSEALHTKKEARRAQQQVKLLRQKLEAAQEREKLTQETLHNVLKVAEKNVNERRQIENLFEEQEATNKMRTSQIIQKADRYKKLVSEFKDLKLASTKRVSKLEKRLIEKDEEIKELTFDYQIQINSLQKSLRSRDTRRKHDETRLIDDELDELCNSANRQNQELLQRISS